MGLGVWPGPSCTEAGAGGGPGRGGGRRGRCARREARGRREAVTCSVTLHACVGAGSPFNFKAPDAHLFPSPLANLLPLPHLPLPHAEVDPEAASAKVVALIPPPHCRSCPSRPWPPSRLQVDPTVDPEAASAKVAALIPPPHCRSCPSRPWPPRPLQVDPTVDPEAASAKVAALMDRLRSAAQRQPADGAGPIKHVVFSQFTGGCSRQPLSAYVVRVPVAWCEIAFSTPAGPTIRTCCVCLAFSPPTGMLDLVSAALAKAGVAFVRLDGSTPAKARADMVRAFGSRQPDSPVVFLVGAHVGVGAGGSPMVCPWWVPGVWGSRRARPAHPSVCLAEALG